MSLYNRVHIDFFFLGDVAASIAFPFAGAVLAMGAHHRAPCLFIYHLVCFVFRIGCNN